MSGAIPRELKREMNEAALLPAGDPRREALLPRIEEAGEEATQLWAELIGENERLRMALRHASVPEGLEERLRQIAETAPLPWWRPRIRGAAIIAAALLAIAALALLLRSPARPPVADAASRLAALAIRDHSGHSHLAVESSDPAEVESGLAGSSTVAARVPPLDDRYRLVGGRACRFGELHTIYTRWIKDGRDHSLYQVRRSDFDLPPDLLPVEVATPPTPGSPAGHRVVIWADGPDAYALVCDGSGDDAPH